MIGKVRGPTGSQKLGRKALPLALCTIALGTSCSLFRQYPKEEGIEFNRSALKMVAFPQDDSEGRVTDFDFIMRNEPHHTLATRFGNIDYVLSQGSADATVIFVHGTPTSWYTFARLIPQMPRHYTVAALSMPGHGYSSRTQAFDFSFDHYASVLNEFIERYQFKNITLVGHSFGAEMVMRAYLQSPRPEAFRHLVLSNPWCPSVLPEKRPLQFTEKMATWPLFGTLGTWLLGGKVFGEYAAHDQAFADFGSMPHAGRIADEIEKSYFSFGLVKMGTTHSFGRMCAEQSRLNAQLPKYYNEVQANSPKLEVPVTVIVAEKDKVIPPAYGRALFDTFIGSSIRARLQTTDTGHMTPLEKPEVLLQAILTPWL